MCCRRVHTSTSKGRWNTRKYRGGIAMVRGGRVKSGVARGGVAFAGIGKLTRKMIGLQSY
jgi:hypothetical protein